MTVYIVLSFSSAPKVSYFQYFKQFIEIFWKKYSLALRLVEMDTDPYRQAMDTDQQDPDPQHWLCQTNSWRIHP